MKFFNFPDRLSTTESNIAEKTCLALPYFPKWPFPFPKEQKQHSHPHRLFDSIYESAQFFQDYFM